MPSREKSAPTRPPKAPSPTDPPPGAAAGAKEEQLAGSELVDFKAPLVPRDIRDTLVIKHGDVFLLTDLMGNVPPGNVDGLGLYASDTRFLSGFDLGIEGLRPTILLSSSHSNFLSEQVLTNPNVTTPDGKLVPEQTIGIRRFRRLVADGARESLTIENFNGFPLLLSISIRLAADFADIFEVRGLVPRDGAPLVEPEHREGVLTFRKAGRDGLTRETQISFDPAPDEIRHETILYKLALPARGARHLTISIEIRPCPRPPSVAVRAGATSSRALPELETSNSLVNEILQQSRRDLQTLVSGEGEDTFMAAGIPWYAALFGRDAIITALLTLWMDPNLARQTLLMLAARQASRDDPWHDAEPGKILHELRRGELARVGAVPFTPYYGTIDATPLWVILLAEYCQSTGDFELVQQLLPNLNAALAWMDRFGDRDGDGFVEYQRRSASGLIHQGWKDSWDGIIHDDGSAVEPPVALVEVQAYVYAAKLAASRLFRSLGEVFRAERLQREAEALHELFNRLFWCEEERYYALALDGRKQQVSTVTSNPGHALFCGIVPRERAELVASRLMAEDLFSGWGIRTLSSRSASYNPTGYHTGTVWPHDNALIALGLKRAGFDQLAAELADAMLQATARFPVYRVPELFCGFARSAFGVPVRYPVACIPQAWAAASCSGFVQVMLGLRPNAPAGELRIARPRLPRSIEWARLSHLPIGGGEIDLHYQRVGDHTAVDVAAMRGEVRVAIVDRWDP